AGVVVGWKRWRDVVGRMMDGGEGVFVRFGGVTGLGMMERVKVGGSRVWMGRLQKGLEVKGKGVVMDEGMNGLVRSGRDRVGGVGRWGGWVKGWWRVKSSRGWSC
ncbi:hypothetical protein, partial [Dermacoccus nishinomiyaensis]|uniref:hypothetical protein n=1 Tax=Dermacoccus nishinomiyaensis TaxID=1274 RepID=UPI0016433E2B